MAYLIYQHGFFQDRSLNGARALGVIMLVVLAGFSAVYVRLTAKQRGGVRHGGGSTRTRTLVSHYSCGEGGRAGDLLDPWSSASS